MTRWYWLSFCDDGDGHFLGACIVDVTDDQAEAVRDQVTARRLENNAPPPTLDDLLCVAAMARAWDLAVNPGGQIGLVPIGDDVAARVPEEYRRILLTRQQCAEFDRVMG